VIGRIDEVVFDCGDPARLAQFWAGVLGGELVQRDPSWCYLDPPGWTRVAFQRVPEPKRSKNRLHLDVEVDDLAVAVAAAETLGACRIGDVEHDSMGRFQVLRDPEGNEWCLVHNEVPIPPSSAR
jgi:catechol 2,3-dioxygenase-like lactoylglutathione lyase family enzyme